ncbi:MAG: HPP family protein [Pseudomonadota bacterium]
MKLPSGFLHTLATLIGVEHDVTSRTEKFIASIGALFGILVVSIVSLSVASGVTAGMIIASMGASAVLLFVVPHGALSQPWPVIGGHLLSATAGVLCQHFFPGWFWTPALAVALAIALMQYLRCVHPPGGATALMAVIGGNEIHQLGFGFLLNPVLLNVLSMVVLALLFNNLFPWRRYPASLMKRQHVSLSARFAPQSELTQEDFEAAMQRLNTFVDISTEDLIELVDLARQHADERSPHPATIMPGRSYSNGRLGRHWSVRQIIDQEEGNKNGRVIYKTLAGVGAWRTGICEVEEFRQWASFEVESKNGRWVRVQAPDQQAKKGPVV